MLELTVTLGLLLLFAASAMLGRAIQSRLPEAHRSREAIEQISMVMSLLITFAALVLSLLTTSAKGVYDKAERDRVHFAAQLTQLDRCMRNYGPGGETVRRQLASYSAAVIASTWPSEPRPVGLDYPDPSTMPRVGPVPILAELMNTVGVEIRKLDQVDPTRSKLADDCYAVYRDVLESRWSVVEDIYSSISTPFFCAVVFWMCLIFAGFGLRAPETSSATIVLMLGIVAVTSAMVLVLDLDLPYEGFFNVPSTSMRAALAEMLQP